jgi:retron-type reverse transcriptase
MEKVRSLEHSITVKRFYLDKGVEKTGVPNGKLRPIGAPNLSAKMIFKALEIVIREILEPKIGKYQHGFMRNKGTQSASLELLTKLRANPNLRVFEFDLKSFFNKVNVIRTCKYLTDQIGPMGMWVRALTTGNIPSILKKDIQRTGTGS